MEEGPWRLLDELGEVVITGPSPEAVIRAIAERCRTDDASPTDVPQAWKHIVRWGWRLVTDGAEYHAKVALKFSKAAKNA